MSRKQTADQKRLQVFIPADVFAAAKAEAKAAHRPLAKHVAERLQSGNGSSAGVAPTQEWENLVKAAAAYVEAYEGSVTNDLYHLAQDILER